MPFYLTYSDARAGYRGRLVLQTQLLSSACPNFVVHQTMSGKIHFVSKAIHIFSVSRVEKGVGSSREMPGASDSRDR